MDVRLASDYRRRMLLLLPLTLGIGTVWLLLLQLRWPSRIDEVGIHLRNGRTIAWSGIQRINVFKDQFFEDEHGVIRLDVETSGRTLSLTMKNFDNGQEVAAAIRNGYAQARKSDAMHVASMRNSMGDSWDAQPRYMR